MKLIRATDRDIQTLLDIQKTVAGQKTYAGYHQEEEIKKWLEQFVVYLIESNGEIAGSISYEIQNENQARISRLVIRPEFRGQGLGKQAMSKLIEELKNYERLTLIVHPENTPAVKLHKSVGFEKESRVENYFGNGEPRLIMSRKNDLKLK